MSSTLEEILQSLDSLHGSSLGGVMFWKRVLGPVDPKHILACFRLDPRLAGQRPLVAADRPWLMLRLCSSGRSPRHGGVANSRAVATSQSSGKVSKVSILLYFVSRLTVKLKKKTRDPSGISGHGGV